MRQEVTFFAKTRGKLNKFENLWIIAAVCVPKIYNYILSNC